MLNYIFVEFNRI